MRVIAVLFVAGGVALGGPARSLAVSESQQLVEKAKLTAAKLLVHKEFPQLRGWMKRAKGVLIVPSMLKAGFVFGAGGGEAILLARDKSGKWSAPAFYTIFAGSFGLQIGVENSEIMFVVMTDKGMKALINNEVKLGATGSMALGPIGAGVAGATTIGLGEDIYAFSKGVGLYGGIALEGAWIKKRKSYNADYYGKLATPKAIVIDRKFNNSGADKLRALLDIR
ncbi:MAG: lipid-binding SYLF domain-containing protein [Alphaproteobacteria bacterium]